MSVIFVGLGYSIRDNALSNLKCVMLQKASVSVSIFSTTTVTSHLFADPIVNANGVGSAIIVISDTN